MSTSDTFTVKDVEKFKAWFQSYHFGDEVELFIRDEHRHVSFGSYEQYPSAHPRRIVLIAENEPPKMTRMACSDTNIWRSPPIKIMAQRTMPLCAAAAMIVRQPVFVRNVFTNRLPPTRSRRSGSCSGARASPAR